MDLQWPVSRAEIAKIQRHRKRLAVERAMQSRFYRGRLDGIDLERLDDPQVYPVSPGTGVGKHRI